MAIQRAPPTCRRRPTDTAQRSSCRAAARAARTRPASSATCSMTYHTGSDGPIHFDIVTGTSVGAIHACYVAGTIGRSGRRRGPRRYLALARRRRRVRPRGADLIAIPLRLLGLSGERRPAEPGIRASRGSPRHATLERLVRERIPWAELRRRDRCGRDRVGGRHRDRDGLRQVDRVGRQRAGVVAPLGCTIRSSSPGRFG